MVFTHIYQVEEKMFRKIKKKLNVLSKSVLLHTQTNVITHWEYILKTVSSKFPTVEAEILEFPNV